MSAHLTLRDLIPEHEAVADGVEELCAALEAHGWYPRKRFEDRGVKYYPDNGRGRQIIIETGYEVNEHRLAEIARHTGLPLVEEKEGETDVNDGRQG